MTEVGKALNYMYYKKNGHYNFLFHLEKLVKEIK